MATEASILTPQALLELPPLPEGSIYELSDGELIIVGPGLLFTSSSKLA